jgi:hypothetical protein
VAVIKTNYQCWHGTYVSWNAKEKTYWHPNSDTPCDDKNPMFVDRNKKK